MLGPYIAGRLRNKDSSATLDSSSRGSEEMGRTEPQPLAILGKDTGHQIKGQSSSNPTTPLGQVRSHGPQFPHP